MSLHEGLTNQRLLVTHRHSRYLLRTNLKNISESFYRIPARLFRHRIIIALLRTSYRYAAHGIEPFFCSGKRHRPGAPLPPTGFGQNIITARLPLSNVLLWSPKNYHYHIDRPEFPVTISIKTTESFCFQTFCKRPDTILFYPHCRSARSTSHQIGSC